MELLVHFLQAVHSILIPALLIHFLILLKLTAFTMCGHLLPIKEAMLKFIKRIK